jgi:Arsenical resistance operon protein ArsD
MKTLSVFDPALCCSTGVCGPTVDPDLARFAGDVEWLKARGVTVERFNLAQQPGAFVEPAVKAALEALGEAALPLVQLGGATVATGHYPSRDVLAKLAGVPLEVEAPKASSCCGPKATSEPDGGSCC